MNKVLIVDDDVTFCMMLESLLNRHGYQVKGTHSFDDALEKVKSFKPEIVLTDLRLPNKDGMEVLKAAREIIPQLPVLLMTSYADIKTAVQAMRLGAFDYVSKPVNPDEILDKIKTALKYSQVAASEQRAVRQTEDLGYVEGVSPVARKINEHVSLVAPTNMSVLILGESGTGKEFIARKIHSESARSDKPFVAIDCGAIPLELAGSELFGHVKGAFTGAAGDKTGQFEYANGGTIFLDEIGNLSYEIQVQLLRAIQERKIRRIGANKEINVDVRIITATNEDLKSAVTGGRFREDLYHRINEFAIFVPPLRKRTDDLIIFANYFLKVANSELNKNVLFFDNEVISIFTRYSWPGNFREFKNVIKRSVLLTKGDTITRQTLPDEIIEEAFKPSEDKETLLGAAIHTERDLILETLRNVDFNKSKAARILKVDRKTLYNKIKIYNIPH